MYEQALHIREKAFGSAHPRATITSFNIGQLHREWGAYEQAKEAIQHALTTHEQALGTEHHQVANILEEYARLLRDLGRNEEAEQVEARVQAMRSAMAKPATEASSK